LDGTDLGWFWLFVAITACVYSYWNFANYSALKSGDPGVGDLVGVLWATWAVLWLLFCLVGALVKARLTRLTGGVVRGTGNLFGLVPALTLVNIPSVVSSALAIVIAIVSVATFIVFFVLTKPKWSVTEGGATGPIASPTAYAPASPA